MGWPSIRQDGSFCRAKTGVAKSGSIFLVRADNSHRPPVSAIPLGVGFYLGFAKCVVH